MTEIQEHCLNCDTPLQGKFCHACGQKQLEPSERTLKYFVSRVFGIRISPRKKFPEKSMASACQTRNVGKALH